MHHGELLEANLARDRMTRDDVMEAMRQAGILRLEDVLLGVLEPNGQISFIRKNSG